MCARRYEKKIGETAEKMRKVTVAPNISDSSIKVQASGLFIVPFLFAQLLSGQLEKRWKKLKVN